MRRNYSAPIGRGKGDPDGKLGVVSPETRIPSDDDWPAICEADGLALGVSYTPEDVEAHRKMHNMSRFRVISDGAAVVAAAGSYAMDVTLPGGSVVPMGGVTWVSTAVTHRRQGLMHRVMDAVHIDIDQRGEPVAALTSSEGGLYGRFGYGIATQARSTSIDPRLIRIRSDIVIADNSTVHVDGDGAIELMADVWERFRRLRAGEVDRSLATHDYLYAVRDKPVGNFGPAIYLAHADGFAVYRIEENSHYGVPVHKMLITELAAVTPDAHAALWRTLLSTELVAEITATVVPIDDPLPFLLTDQRVVRTTDLKDRIWVNVRDPAIAFGARTYRTADRIVIEADGRRWAIEGGLDGGSCKLVRTRPDLVTTHAGFSSLLYGGVLPSGLVAGRRMTARTPQALARADLFFPTSLAPHCQTNF